MAHLSKLPRFIIFFHFSILFLASIQTSVLSNTYKVGDLDSWGIPTSSNPLIYNIWSKYHNLKMGDSLFFLYPPSRDSVIQVRDVESYNSCNLKDPILHLNDGNSLFNITKPGDFYFISGVEGHCEKSQELHIFVYGNGSSPISSAPAPDSAAAPSYPTVFGFIPVQASASSFLKIPVFMISAAIISSYMP
ncbi:early nodulin-like protein 8 [Primulina huaijiensis]|uniref:early nodulin-like protein 8 n=1 Tax=Primulina huaijiensis TaxID=1492673 RepID=UPI003CC74284